MPVRVEFGPRDLATGSASLSRRDRGPKEREAVPLAELAGRAAALLEEMQRGMFERAAAFRTERSVRLGSAAEVRDFFGTGEVAGRGGFAYVHVADDPAVAEAFDPLKVTVRCIPMDGEDEPGTCVVTGRPVPRRSVLARSY